MIIGLTGGIGSGKSAAAKFFEILKINVIDADQLAKEVIAKGTPGYLSAVEAFTVDILDKSGEIDRALLRTLVFNNPDQKKILESITHPLVQQLMLKKISLSTSLYKIIMVPLIYETNTKDLYDRVLVIDCDQSLQLKRATARDNNSNILIQKIIDSQCSREERLSIANDIIPNNDTLKDLQTRVNQLHNFYLGYYKNE